LELGQDLADLLEAVNTLSQLRQFCQGRVRAATAIKQSVNFLHEVSQRSQLWQTTRGLLQRSTFRRRAIVLNKETSMFEQVGDSLLQPFATARHSLGRSGRGPTTLAHRLSDDRDPGRGPGEEAD
jgi:hypothetical protein